MGAMWQKAAWVGAGATMGIALSLAITVDANRDAKSTIPLDELRTFSEVYSRVKNDYVESVSDKKLIEQAIGGMVSSLDPHSTFLDESAFKDLRTTTTGKFGGIGIDRLVHGDHHAHLHQRLDDIGGTFGHPVGKFRNNDGFRQLHVAHLLFGLLAEAQCLLTSLFLLPLHRGKRTLASAFTVDGVAQGEAGHGQRHQKRALDVVVYGHGVG